MQLRTIALRGTGRQEVKLQIFLTSELDVNDELHATTALSPEQQFRI